MGALLDTWEDSGLCTGCRACVLICSFHHSGHFAPAEASIQVKRNNADGTIIIELFESCDMCLSDLTPRCLEFCPRDCLAVNHAGYPSKPQRMA